MDPPAQDQEQSPGAPFPLRRDLLGDATSLQQIFDVLQTASSGVKVSRLERPDGPLMGVRYNFLSDAGGGHFGIVRLAPDLFVLSTNVSVERDELGTVVGQDFVEFHFRLSGRLSLYPNTNGSEAVDVDQGSLLIWRQPEGMNIMERMRDEERERSLTIYLRPSALKRYFDDYASSLPPDIAKGLSCESSGLFFMRMACYPKVTDSVRELWGLNIETSRALVRCEALVMMILCEVMTMLEDARDIETDIRLSDADVRCLRHARNHLRSHHTPPPTIEEVARTVGLSATKLKAGFKALFGKSPSHYANDLRMAYALDLLRRSDLPILSVAETLGYEYQNSFTVAFRRHFNVLPKDYRRDPTILGDAATKTDEPR